MTGSVFLALKAGLAPHDVARACATTLLVDYPYKSRAPLARDKAVRLASVVGQLAQAFPDRVPTVQELVPGFLSLDAEHQHGMSKSPNVEGRHEWASGEAQKLRTAFAHVRRLERNSKATTSRFPELQLARRCFVFGGRQSAPDGGGTASASSVAPMALEDSFNDLAFEYPTDSPCQPDEAGGGGAQGEEEEEAEEEKEGFVPDHVMELGSEDGAAHSEEEEPAATAPAASGSQSALVATASAVAASGPHGAQVAEQPPSASSSSAEPPVAVANALSLVTGPCAPTTQHKVEKDHKAADNVDASHASKKAKVEVDTTTVDASTVAGYKACLAQIAMDLPKGLQPSKDMVAKRQMSWRRHTLRPGKNGNKTLEVNLQKMSFWVVSDAPMGRNISFKTQSLKAAYAEVLRRGAWE